MKDISLNEIDAMRRDIEYKIRESVLEFFNKTGLVINVDIITTSQNTNEGKVFSVDVKVKAVIE